MSKIDYSTQNYIPIGVKVNDSLLEKERSKQKDNLFFLIISFFALVVMLIVVVLNTFVFFIADVDGSSMYPTLTDGDKLMTNRYKDIEIDSIITVKQKDGNGNDVLWIKRVIALGGDRVEIKDGYVYVNGNIKAEPYVEKGVKTESIKDGINYEYDSVTWTLQEDEVFFLGDNRAQGKSTDSRFVGPCKKSDVVGVVEEWSLRLNARKK